MHYIETAQDFYAGRWWAGLGSYYSPGYPLLLAAVYPLVGEWELGGQLLSIFCGVAILYPLYVLFRDLYDDQVAAVAAFLVALSPYLARYSVHVRSESPFFFLTVIALLIFQRGFAARSMWYFLAGGLVTGFAYLVRPEAIGLLAVVPLYLGVRWCLLREESLAWITKISAASLAGFALLGLPYIVYLSIDTGQWGSLTRKAGVTLSVSLNESGLLNSSELEGASADETKDFVGFIRSHPLLFGKKAVNDFFPTLATFFEAIHYPYVPLFLFGLALALRGRFWQRKDFFLLTYVLFFVFGLAIILVRRRYLLQVVPVCMGWTALGALAFVDWIKSYFNEYRTKIALALTVAIFLAATLPKTLTPISREKSYVREAGLYLKQRGGSNLRVAVFDDRITFYAGASALMLDDIKEANLANYLRQQRPQYLAAEAKTWQRVYPNIAQQPAQSGLSLEREFVGLRADRMLLFRVS